MNIRLLTYRLQSLSALVNALTYLQGTSFTSIPRCLPIIQLELPALEESPAFELPSVLVPPDAMDLDDSGGSAPGPTIEDGKAKSPATSEFPYFCIRLFDNQVRVPASTIHHTDVFQTTPDASTPAGYVISRCLLDMLDIFEINRKEGARLMLELPRWFDYKTFKGRRPDGDNLDGEGIDTMQWNLEATTVEVRVSSHPGTTELKLN